MDLLHWEANLKCFEQRFSDYIHLSNYLQQKINQLINNELPQQRTNNKLPQQRTEQQTEQQQQQITISTNTNSTYTHHNRIRTLPQTTTNTTDTFGNTHRTQSCNIL